MPCAVPSSHVPSPQQDLLCDDTIREWAMAVHGSLGTLTIFLLIAAASWLLLVSGSVQTKSSDSGILRQFFPNNRVRDWTAWWMLLMAGLATCYVFLDRHGQPDWSHHGFGDLPVERVASVPFIALGLLGSLGLLPVSGYIPVLALLAVYCFTEVYQDHIVKPRCGKSSLVWPVEPIVHCLAWVTVMTSAGYCFFAAR